MYDTFENIVRIVAPGFFILGCLLYVLPVRISEKLTKNTGPRASNIVVESIFYGVISYIVTYISGIAAIYIHYGFQHNSTLVSDQGSLIFFLVTYSIIFFCLMIAFAFFVIPKTHPFNKTFRMTYSFGWLPLVAIVTFFLIGLGAFGQELVDWGFEDFVCPPDVPSPLPTGLRNIGVGLVLLVLAGLLLHAYLRSSMRKLQKKATK